MNSPTPEEILTFWFGELADGWTVADKKQLWFGFSSQDDKTISAKFGGAVNAALNGELSEWQKTPAHTVAYIVLLDQMTRAIFRGTARAFAGDAAALAACKAGIAAGADKQCPAVYRFFFYMPLEHSENLRDQDECVALFVAMEKEFPHLQDKLSLATEATVEHRELIRQFGRFPHRNAVLRRESTAEEIAFLQKQKSTFGQ